MARDPYEVFKFGDNLAAEHRLPAAPQTPSRSMQEAAAAHDLADQTAKAASERVRISLGRPAVGDTPLTTETPGETNIQDLGGFLFRRRRP